MKPVPTHHRAVAIVLAVASVAALARAAPPPPVAPPRVPEAPAPPRRINPQTADAHALESLPGVGPAIARRIVAARARGLTFRRPEDLLRVRGIGPTTLRRMRDALDFGEATTGRSSTTRPR